MRKLQYFIITIILSASFASNAFPDTIVQNEFPAFDPSAYAPVTLDPKIINASMSIPIEVPVGINDIEPALAISYASNNQNTLYGTGWDIQLASIERSTKRGIPKYDNSDLFIFTQEGQAQELVFDSSSGLYHPEIESAFMKMEFLGESWLVTSRSGTKYFFGFTDDSRQYDSLNPARIFKWNLNRVEDVHGNYMTITYFKDNNQVYPWKIEYSGNVNTGLLPYAQVEFERETRATPYMSYKTGFLVKTLMRIARIFVRAEGALQGKYELGYAQSEATRRDILTSVTQFGSDGTSALPATLLTYYGNEKGFQETSAGIPQGAVFSESISGADRDLGVRIADVNADGYPDILKNYITIPEGQKIRDTYINGKNNTWNSDSGWAMPEICIGTGVCTSFISRVTSMGIPMYADYGLRVADINGDGRNDLIHSLHTQAYYNGSGGAGMYKSSFLNIGSGWGGDRPDWYLMPGVEFMSWYSFITGYSYGYKYEKLGNIFSDVNNDGYLDIVTSKKAIQSSDIYNNTVVSKNTYLNIMPTSAGWTLNSNWTPPNTEYTDFSNGADSVDLNADGLPDIFYRKSGLTKVYMNTGNGWVEDPYSPWNDTLGYGELTDGSTQFGDINGDGFADMIIAKGNLGSGSKVLINSGNGWFIDDAWVFPEGDFRNIGTRLLDANADMLLDFMIHYNNASPKLYLNRGTVADMLKTFDNGLGGVTSIQYGSSSQYNNTFLPFSLPVITSINRSNSLGDSYETRYSYAEGLWVPEEREFRGFGFIKVTDPEGNYAETQYHQDAVKKGKVFEQRQYDSAGRLLSKVANLWEAQSIAPGANFVYLKKKDNFSYADAGTGKRSAEEFFYAETPQLGNLTKTIQWGEVDFASGANISQDMRTVETEYLNNTGPGNWLVGLPRLITVKNNNSELMRKTWLNYDSHDNTTLPVKGLLTRKEEWLGDEAGVVNPVTSFGYNDFGMLSRTIEPKGYISDTIYDSRFGIFPITTRNHLGHTVINEYYGINGVPLDSGDGLSGLWGKIKSSTDANSQKTQYSYDTFGRMALSISPLDNISFPTETIQYQLNSNYTLIISAKRVNHGEAKTLNTYQFYDGLGRPILTKGPAATADKCIVKEQTKYSFRNLAQESYLPYFSTNPIDALEGVNPGLAHTTIIYDGLGRVIRANNPDGTYKTVEYAAWTTKSIDENGHKQESDADAFGRLVTKREYRGADGRFPALYPNTAGYTLYATTRYSYDCEGSLVKIIDAHGNETNLVYDKLGRKVSLNDPDMGLWFYEYDLNGNMNKQTDNKSQIIQLDHEELNRLRNRTGPGLSVEYTYDDPLVSFSKGRLTKSQFGLNRKTEFRYDCLGRETRRIRTIDQSVYSTDTLYDALDRVASLSYPDQTEVIYTYDDAGQIKVVQANLPPLPPAPEPPVLNDPVSGDASVTLNWSVSTGVTGYKVKYGTVSGNYPTVIDVGNVTTRQITGLTNGIAYYFIVTAYNAYGESSPSNEKSATPQVVAPNAPVLNSATAGDTVVTLSWSNAITATGYKVKYGTVSGSYPTVINVGNVTTKQITGLTNGITYYFVVSAYNQGGESANSNEKSATPAALPHEDIVFDATSSAQVDDANQISFSHTVTASGANRALIVSVFLKDATTIPRANSITYGGRSLRLITRISKMASGKIFQNELWGLLNPPTGNNTVTLKFNTSTDGVAVGAISLTGVKQGLPDAVAKLSGTSTQASVNITTKTSGAWVIDSVLVDEAGSPSVTVNAGQAQRFLERNSADVIGASSTKAVPVPGQTNMRWNLSARKTWASIAVALAPASLSTPAKQAPIAKLQSALKRLANLFLDAALPKNAYAASDITITDSVSEVAIVSNAEYNAAGQILKIEYGNGAITEYTYDDNTLRLKRIQTFDAGNFSVQDLTYTYDGVGNVISIFDAVNTTTQSFQYDELNRLIQADGAGYGAKPFSYDEIGNIISKDTNTYGYGSGVSSGAGPHAVTSLSDGTAFTYDLNGNMRTRQAAGHTSEYLYDAENQLTGVKKDSLLAAEYAYDDEGERIKKTVSGQAAYFVDGLFEQAGTDTVTYIFLGQIRIASVNNGQVFSCHPDHLGSTSLITDSQGSKKELAEYAPYGETTRSEQYGTTQEITSRYFTGQYLDSESELYYYGARYYSPGLARFISADSLIDNFEEPQNINPYSYCLNNPVTFIDPEGYSSFDFQNAFTLDPIVVHPYRPDLAIDFSLPWNSIYRQTYTSVLYPGYSNLMNSIGNNISNWWSNNVNLNTLEDASNALMMSNPIPDASPLGPLGLADQGVALLGMGISKTGKTVLGHFPEYIQKARKIGASYFDIGKKMNLLSKKRQWTANKRFLDIISKRKDQIYLSVSKMMIRAKSTLSKEIKYLIEEKGYKWVNQWSLKQK
ncbi:MAG: SpvB/TcaC N-terminal domain-containing protein [Candidatus Omnitrophota bacterium]